MEGLIGFLYMGILLIQIFAALSAAYGLETIVDLVVGFAVGVCRNLGC